jgi:hypothetical protein
MSASVFDNLILLIQGPAILVCIVALVLSLVRWRRHPTRSALAFAGSLVLLADTAGGIASGLWVRDFARWRGISVVHAFVMISIMNEVLRTVGLSLLVAAIFKSREPATPEMGFPVRMSDAPGYRPPPAPPRYR